MSDRERGDEATRAGLPTSEAADVFDAVFTAALDAIFIADDQRRYILVNDAAAELFGVPRAQLIGRRIEEFAEPGADFDTEASWREFLEAGALDGTFPLRRPDGTVRIVEYRARASIMPGRHLSIMRDVTEREGLRRAAEQASRAKDEFLAMLGHELRNPLAPIQTAVELMALRDPERRLARERETIERQVRHLVRLVDDLLDISRVTRGKIELRRESLELRSLLIKAVEIASPLLEERRHHLRIGEVPQVFVVGDAVRLGQVFTNLLTNAAKYTEPGGTIEIVARVEDGQAVVAVRDTGIGIAPEMLPRVFELFAQVQQSIDRSRGGLGIGLHLVQRVLELHGGAIAVTSRPGEGSEFVVRLPLGTAAAPEPDPSDRSAQAPPRRAPATPRRVLVVDDNVDAAALIAESLAQRGHLTRQAHDGPSALRAAADFRPDAIVLDIGLPLMDGYEVASQLRAERGGGDLRIVAVTGYGQSSDVARSMAAGIDEHLVKPVEMDALARVLDRFFER